MLVLKALVAGARYGDGIAEHLSERSAIALHEAMTRDALIAQGMSLADAAAAARRAMGNATAMQETSREAWRFGWLRDAIQDVACGGRGQPTRSARLALELPEIAASAGVRRVAYSCCIRFVLCSCRFVSAYGGSSPRRHPQGIVHCGSRQLAVHGLCISHQPDRVCQCARWRVVQWANCAP
jgi:hypothetical protein